MTATAYQWPPAHQLVLAGSRDQNPYFRSPSCLLPHPRAGSHQNSDRALNLQCHRPTKTPMIGKGQDFFMDVDDITHCFQAEVALVESDGVVSREAVLASIPDDPSEVAMLGVFQGQTHPMHFSSFTGPMLHALVLEKYGEKEKALSYVEMALETDQTKGGTPVVWWHILALRCRGRVLASMDGCRGQRADEAVAAFELASSTAADRGYWMLEALSVRDLVEHVMVGRGELEEGRARLAPLLSRLSGTREELAGFFGSQVVQ